MNAQIHKLYAQFRANPSMIHTGRNAECALRCARTLARFRELESHGLVRLRAEEEQENYFDVYGREDSEKYQKQMEETLQRYGCWWIVAEWLTGEEACDGSDEWEQADSIGMCVYYDPLSPFENCYVIGLMQSAIDALENSEREHLETQMAQVWP